MDGKPKLFVVLSRVPYPLEKGDKLRAYHQIKALSNVHEIHLFCLSESKIPRESIDELNKIVDHLTIFKLNKILILWNLFKAIFSGVPFQVAYFNQFKARKVVRNIISEYKPDSIYCQLVRTTEYVKDIHHIPKTLDYMDAFSKGMYRRSEISKGIKKYFFKTEGDRLKLYEHKMFDYFDHHTIISEQDKKYISHNNQAKIITIENGIDKSFFEANSKVTQVYDLLFVGNLSYAPNIECCHYLLDELLADLIKWKPDVKILLAGANPNESLVSKVKNLENVELSGWIDDIRTAYWSAKIFVAPLFIGTGLQNKLLESMALGIPCVTTSLANNALNAEVGKDILISDSQVSFIENIKSLLEDSELYGTISKNGKEYVRGNFNWENSTKKIPLN